MIGQNWINQQSCPGFYAASDKIRKGQLSSDVTLQVLLVIYAVVITLIDKQQAHISVIPAIPANSNGQLQLQWKFYRYL